MALHIGVWLDWVDLKSARFINDKMAEITAQYPGRLIPLAHVPPFETEGQKELRRAVLKLGCKGVGINTLIGGLLLDNEQLYPFWSPEEIRFAVHMMGENQVLMGSDFPTIGLLKNAVTIIQKAKTTAEVKKKVLGKNAQRLFR